MAFGFFKGDDFDNFQLLCRTTEYYDKLPNKKNSDKIILKILNEDEKMLLELASLAPLYVSLSHENAIKDSESIFHREFWKHVDQIKSESSHVFN